MQCHASCVKWFGNGILLLGESGAGKSEAALRLLHAGAELVADDITLLREKDGKLLASAPTSLQGMLEVRGVGILRYPYVAESAVHVAVALGEEERLPAQNARPFGGVTLPVLTLNHHHAMFADKVRAALHALQEPAHIDVGFSAESATEKAS
ncbi:MAG: hypothetical protein CMM94_03035 [Rickettsiales bacterium]|nr:hypothetical protein [Rickettsiales bacterium]